MRSWASLGICAVLSIVAVTANGQTATVPPPTPWSVVSRTADSEILTQTTYLPSPTGQAIPQVHQITRVASGENYFDGSEWQTADPVFQISADGQSVYADKVQMPVRIKANLAASDSVTVTSPDGITLSTTPIAIGLYDSASGNSVVIGEITNCSGSVYGDAQVAFTNCFNGLSADVLFTLKKGSFSQDVVFEQNINPLDYGFPKNTTWIQIFTAINGPTPREIARPIYVERDEAVRSQMASPDFIDHTLMLGQLKFGAGRVFSSATTNTLQAAPIAKAIENINGQSYLVESIELKDVEKELQTLPSRTARLKRHGRHREEMAELSPKVRAKGLKNLAIPKPGRATKATFAIRSHKDMLADAAKTKGLHVDYVALPATEPDPMVFVGDETFFVDGPFDCDDVILSGGSVVKYPNDTNAYIEVDGNLTCATQPWLPCVITAADDNSVGQSMNGVWNDYSGSVSGCQYGTYGLELLNGAALHDIRIEYAATGIYSSGSVSATNAQIVGCGQGIGIDGDESTNIFDNCLITGVPYGGFYGVSDTGNASYAFNNCTIDEWEFLFFEGSTNNAPVFSSLNSIYARIGNEMNEQGLGPIGLGGWFHLGTVSHNGFYDCTAFGTGSVSTNFFPFRLAGGSAYYLTNACVFRGAGTPGLDPAFLTDLAQKTTEAPIVYDNTNISFLGTLGPQATRENTNAPDIGFAYYPLDFVFAGCNLTNALTFSSGTSVGWYEDDVPGGGVGSPGQPYSICLGGGAVLAFNGTATQPCTFTRYAMVQEGENGNWTGDGWMGAIAFNGGTIEPQLSADFTKFNSDNWNGNLFRDTPASGAGAFRNCEFYNLGISSYEMSSLAFTNCLFSRFNQSFWGESHLFISPSLAYANCTFYNGGLYLGRFTSASPWLFENCAFDGTAFDWQDSLHGTNSTTINYNAYNTNNLSWTNYPYFSAQYGTNEVVGPNDLTVSNYNFQTSWFGNFYQPSNSATFHAGSTTANLLGLYWFTTQTNQTIEGTNQVTIGYNYVATTGTNGDPLSMCGTNDYILYPDGPPTNLLQIISGPNSLTVTQGSNATFSVTVQGTPLGYQWYWDNIPLSDDGGGVSGSGAATLNLIGVNPNEAGAYYVVVTNSSCSVTSTWATLTVVSSQPYDPFPKYYMPPYAYWNVTDISDPAQPVNIGELQEPFSESDYTSFDGQNIPGLNTPWHSTNVTISVAYGTAKLGGAGYGTVFEISTNGNCQILRTFTNADGAYPCSQLALSGSTFYGIPNTLFGTTLGGGSNGYGTVFRVNADGSGFTNLYDFTGGSDGKFPRTGLLIDGNTLYGTTTNSIFKINTDGSDFTCLTTNITNASQLILSLSGDTLYGTTTNEGSYGGLFSVSAAGTNLTWLHNFTGGSSGAFPIGSLEILECSNTFIGGLTATDVLFGVTYGGGINSNGVVFSVDTDGSNFMDLHDFAGTGDGAHPAGGLLLTNNSIQSGNISNYLYGTTSTGGTNGGGTIFGMNPDGTGFATLYSFGGATTNANMPEGKLVFQGSTLYGTTSGGGLYTNGTVFSLNNDGTGFSDLHDFSGGSDDGAVPLAGLAMPAGDDFVSIWLLETTLNVSGDNLTNLTYSIAIDDSYALYVNGTLVDNTNTDGEARWFPFSPLPYLRQGNNDIRVAIAGNDDKNEYFAMQIKSPFTNDLVLTNAFGTTSAGGAAGFGTVFEISSNRETVLYSFAGGPDDGGTPVGDLVLFSNTLYGVTQSGGTNETGVGVIFSISTSGTNYQIFHSFADEPDGTEPHAGLILSSNRLYGTTFEGGTGGGTIFSIDTSGSNYQVLYNFGSVGVGINPDAPLLLLSNTLYGTTRNGGAYDGGVGTLFSYNIGSSNYQTLYSFGANSADGQLPLAGLTFSSNALNGITLYGTTEDGGANRDGTIFSYNIGSSNYQCLHSFGSVPNDGANPDAGLVLSGNTWFGTTSKGGAVGLGTVFSINTDGSGYTILLPLGSSADTSSGGAPLADLLIRGNLLYGTTSKGGANNEGIVFGVSTNGADFDDVYDFSNSPDGANPKGGICSP